MLKRASLFAGVVTASALWACPAYAASEIYTITGTGSGSLNGTAFSNAAFTFTLTGDPTTLQTLGLITVIDPLTTATVTIGGLGPVTFGLDTRLGQNNVEVFFSRASGGNDLFDFMLSSGVNLASNFGPVTGTNVTALNQFINVATSGGNLTFTQSSSVQFSGTLSNTSLPEPATWATMMLGFAGIGFAARRNRKAISTKRVV